MKLPPVVDSGVGSLVPILVFGQEKALHSISSAAAGTAFSRAPETISGAAAGAAFLRAPETTMPTLPMTKTQHCKYCGNPSKQLTSHLAAGTCYIQRSKCQQQGYERHGEQHSPFQCRRRERAQHHQDAVYKCRNGEFRAVTGSAGELRIIQNLPNLLGLCSPSSGLRRIGGCRCGQKCRIKNRQEFSGPSATIITGHVQFDGRPVSTLSAGFQRELGSVICVECHRSLSDVLFIHGERGAGGQLVVDGLHYLLQTGRIHTIVVRRSLGGNILNWRHCLRRRHRLFGRRNELGGRIIAARSRWLIAAGGEGCRLLTIVCHVFPLSLPATSPARKRRDMRA